MTLIRHELRAHRVSLIVWSAVIASMTLLTMCLYPAFKDQTAALSSMFSMMGPFTAALGLDQLDFTTAMGFYGIETGTMLSVGGAMFAALVGIALLSKEEGGHTAEFLLTQPISRSRVVLEKLLALLALLLLLNVFCLIIGWLSFPLIGEPVDISRFLLFHALQLLVQVEIGCLCFGLSAFARRSQIGVGLGLSLLLYFVSLIVNMVDSVQFLRYITPFSYAEASVVFTNGTVEWELLAVGLALTLLGVAAAFAKYRAKDIAA